MPVLRQCDPALQSFLLTSNEFSIADLYTFTLITGAVLRLTSWDVALKSGGNVFSTGPLISRSSARFSNKVEVDQLKVKMAGDLSMLVTVTPPGSPSPASMPLPQALEGGWFRGAKLLVQKLYMPFVSGVPTVQFNPIWWFSGKVGQVEYGPLQSTMTVNSDLYIIDNYLPKHVLQPGCQWTLYDQGCTLSPASFAFNNTVGSGSGQLLIAPGTAFGGGTPDGYFDQGKITFTAGQNYGISRTVKQQLNGKLYLHVAFPFPLVLADAFTVYAGCDRQQSTCATKFSNIANFEGEPYIPAPEITL